MECDNPGYLITVPYRSSQAARIGERLISAVPDERWRTFRNRWDWDSFAVLNALWEREIARMERGGAGRIFMDVWDQALQRPDAHTEL
jgi:hypothetical protein